MVAKWDSQQAMKPPAFDQDDHVTSVDGLLDIAVTSRGGRLNSGWKKVSHACKRHICTSWRTPMMYWQVRFVRLSSAWQWIRHVGCSMHACMNQVTSILTLYDTSLLLLYTFYGTRMLPGHCYILFLHDGLHLSWKHAKQAPL